MKRNLSAIIGCLFSLVAVAQKTPTIYIDKNGVMRWSDTRQEASFFGVNYTLPFAHAYRATGYLGVDRKAAIDRDVYHFARLGLNAYRIHIWDVELSDEKGNLIQNEHLDLFDYLIAKLKERGIYIVITAQTNFGNGYPERNQITNGFSYHYNKCNVHSDPQAIAAQERYLSSLVQHVNPYTGKAYMDDPSIIGFEINNEPCHAGSQSETRDYINRLLKTLKRAGNSKPVFYNVSHNIQQTEAYYSTAIQGTTYQWYPTGLVAGRTRKGNFLPYVDSYQIPFSDVKGFDQKAKLVYEFDPADLMYSYMYPAMVRTFRSTGFQWITQFSYDPVDLAWANTEYQTHYLNLVYTPRKAISMKIAAEAAYRLPRNRSYGVYPENTVFGDFRVSYLKDLSELNTPEKFYYSNHTATVPVDANRLQSIAGYGQSPVVGYEGTGAYFIDKLEDGLWRLEVMPDAVQVSDPFTKPSLKKEVVKIFWGKWDMRLNLPNLGKAFSITGINKGNQYRDETTDGIIRSLQPGVYLLQQKGLTAKRNREPGSAWENIRLDEYVAPQKRPDHSSYTVSHIPAKTVEAGKPLVIESLIAGAPVPDSVLIYTDKISFWNDKNFGKKMEYVSGYLYRAVIPETEIKEGHFRYTLVICKDGKRLTFPAGVPGSPLDWDYTDGQYWETEVVAPDKAIVLFSVTDELSGMEAFTIPEWSFTFRRLEENFPVGKKTLHLTFNSKEDHPRFFLRKYIREEVAHREDRLETCTHLCLHLKKVPEGLHVGFITSDGYTYNLPCPLQVNEIVRIPLKELRQTKTALLPNSYPVFLDKYFSPAVAIPFRTESIESIELSFDGKKDEAGEIEIGNIWLE
ncbi:MAG: cellulase family glycosylhydrolase [Mangrovibacterium sp.]